MAEHWSCKPRVGSSILPVAFCALQMHPWQDSNLQPPDPWSGALPLSHTDRCPKMYGQPGSNRRSHACGACVLTTRRCPLLRLRKAAKVADVGFDPTTCGLWAHRADHCATLLLPARKGWCDEGGVRTHASEEIAALTQRLRPLGHLATAAALGQSATSWD